MERSGPPAPGLRGVAFFGGGSGGHLFPGIAVAERLRERFADCRIAFCPSGRAIERRIFADWPFEVYPAELDPPGRSPAGWLRYGREVRAATARARDLLSGDFDVVFGLGGYAALPGILAARRLGIPTVLLEQNRVAGRANRWLAPLVRAVASTFPDVRLRCRGRLAVTGNPVRRRVREAGEWRATRWRGAELPGAELPGAGASAATGNGVRATVLVVGGSQGARAINRAVIGALAGLEAWRDRVRWIHVAGVADRATVERAYRSGGWKAKVFEYASELPELMARSDLVISRAGGTTLAELAVVGVPAVLVPYRHHRDRHQYWNARVAADAGAAVLADETDLGAELFERVFREVLFSRPQLDAMASEARKLGCTGAADAVVDLAVELRSSCRTAFASSC